jgi:hypothetical protein
MEALAHSRHTDFLWRQTTMTIGTGIHEVSDRAAINICIGSDQPCSIQYVQYLVVIIRSPSPAVATGNRGTSCHGVATNWCAVIYRPLASLYTAHCRRFAKKLPLRLDRSYNMKRERYPTISQ